MKAVLDDLTDEDSDTDDDENAVSHGEWNDFWMTKLDNVTEERSCEWFPVESTRRNQN